MVYGRVYAIRSHQTTDIYIGSTEQILCKRMSDHRKDYKRYLNYGIYDITSIEILKHEDAYIELIYEGEFESKYALKRKEGEYQRSMDCVNRCVAGQTQQESKQKYRENKNFKQKITCECGSIICIGAKSLHLKSIKHQLFLQNSK